MFKKRKKKKNEIQKKKCFIHITRWLFVTTQIAALTWVSISYFIAIYSTIKCGEPFPVVELSQQAINTILGVNILKVIENIFEHNDGFIYGKSKIYECKEEHNIDDANNYDGT